MNSTQSMKHNHVGMGYSNKGMKLIKKSQLITFGIYGSHTASKAIFLPFHHSASLAPIYQ